MKTSPIKSNHLSKFYVRFRKKYILPLKWWSSERRVMKGMVWPTKKQILEMKKEIEGEMVKNKINETNEDIWYNKGRLDILDWFIYGEPKE